MKVEIVFRDGAPILVASTLERAQELAQTRAHAFGLHIYRWEDDGRKGFAHNTLYQIEEYKVDDPNLK